MLKVYGFKDKVKGIFDCCTLAYTDADAVRRLIMMNGGSKPLCDIEVYEVASANEETGVIKEVPMRLVDQTCYSFPKSQEEELRNIMPNGDANKEE